MDCRICIEKLNEYTDNELDSKLMNEISLHIENCPSCKNEYEFLKEIIKNCNEINEEPPKKLKEKVLEKIMKNEKSKKIIFFRKTAISIASTAAIFAIIIFAYNSVIMKTYNSKSNMAIMDNERQVSSIAQGETENFSEKGIIPNNSNSSTVSSNNATSYSMDKSAEQAQAAPDVSLYKYSATFNGKSIENIDTIKELIPLSSNNNIYEYKTTLSLNEIKEKLKALDIVLNNSQENSLNNSINYGNIKIIIN